MKHSIEALLDQQTIRIIQIIEVMTLDREWITLEDLALELKTNEKTIEKDFNMIHIRWNNLLNVEYDIRFGIRFKHRTIAIMGKIFNELFREQEPLRFLEKLVLDPGMGIDYYAQELFVSKSSLYRYIQRLNKGLEYYNLSVETDKGKYQLKAENELYARHFLTCFFIELHGSHAISQHDQWLGKELIELITKEIFSRYHVTDDVQRSYFLWLLEVSFLRETSGIHLGINKKIIVPIYKSLVQGVQKVFPNLAEEEIRNSISSIDVQYTTPSQIYMQPEFA